MNEVKHTNLECVSDTFRPCQPFPVRWLDWEADFHLAREAWPFPISHEDWLSFRDEGYQYCAVIEGGTIQSTAAIWHYSDTAWEVAGVFTIPQARRRGCGKSVVSFVTAAILAAGRLATCLIVATNTAMIRTAESVGFYPAPRV